MSWLEVLIQWIDRLWPVVFIRPYQRGVAFICGRWVREVKPGAMLKILGVLEIDVVDVVEQIVELPVQSVTTKDRKPLAVKSAVRYRVTDPVAYHVKVSHTDTSIVNLCLVHMHHQIRRRTLDQIMKGQGGLERAILGRLGPHAERWGVAVESFALTDLVEARHYRLYNDHTA